MKDLIKNAVDDITQEIENSVIDEKNDKKRNPANYIGDRGSAEERAWNKILLPNFFGIFLGFAVARLFHSGAFGYIFFGTVFSFLTGVWKSYELDNIALKNAVVKNALLMGIWLAVFAVWLIIFHIK